LRRSHGYANPKATDELIRRVSAGNQDSVRAYVKTMLARGRKQTTVQLTVRSLLYLDGATNGTPYGHLTPDTLTNCLHEYARSHAPGSASAFAAHLKAYYSWCNDDECPRAIRRALKRDARLDWKDVTPISEDEFRALLRAAVETTNVEAVAARRVAILWLLWDSGFRLSELLAVRLCDVQFDNEGAVTVGMDPAAPDLKTGPRRIFLIECAGALRAWIALHPDAQNPNARLFVNRSGDDGMYPGAIHKLLKMLAKAAGLRHIHPHLFRHTRATRAADAGWNEPQMRPFFGWSATSTMPTRYIHLSKRQLQERIRRDANVDALGARIREDPKQAIADAVSSTIEALAKRGLLGIGNGRPVESAKEAER
jgi:integrase